MAPVQEPTELETVPQISLRGWEEAAVRRLMEATENITFGLKARARLLRIAADRLEAQLRQAD